MMWVIFVGIYLFDLALLAKFIRDEGDPFTFRRSRNKIAIRSADCLMIAGILTLFAEFGMGLLIIATGMLLGGMVEFKVNLEKAYFAFYENTNPGRLK